MTHPIPRRHVLPLFAAALLAAHGLGQAQTPNFPQPGKPVRIVVPFPPGSGSDVNARIVAKQLQDLLGGHPVIIDNKPGAGTFIGAQEVARAPADGHTLLYTIVITHTQNPHLYSKLPYDPFKDFAPVMLVGGQANVCAVRSDAGIDTMKGLVRGTVVTRSRGDLRPAIMMATSGRHSIFFEASASLTMATSAAVVRSSTRPSTGTARTRSPRAIASMTAAGSSRSPRGDGATSAHAWRTAGESRHRFMLTSVSGPMRSTGGFSSSPVTQPSRCATVANAAMRAGV